jgi:hypothetical protein
VLLKRTTCAENPALPCAAKQYGFNLVFEQRLVSRNRTVPAQRVPTSGFPVTRQFSLKGL